MNKHEYWLLDYVVDSPAFALEWLLAGDPSATHSTPRHHLTYPVLVETLYRLFQQRDIVAQRINLTTRALLGDTFVPTREQIKAALLGELPLAYALTPRGGARWENHARPDWNRYICYQPVGKQELQIAGTERHLVQQALTTLPQRQALSVLAGTERWDTLVPWEATYWKVLPGAHRVRFRVTWQQPLADVRQLDDRSWIRR